MLNVRVKKALLTILTACLTVLMMVGAVLGFTPATQTVKAATDDEVKATWTLVTDASTLAAGDKIVIVASGSDHALGTTQNGNNRNAVSVKKSGDNVTVGSTVEVLTLEEGKKSGTFAFRTGDNKYLYAVASSGNYLRSQSSIDDNASWSISISNKIATIKASNSSYTNKQLMKNSSSALFSCYGGTQKTVSIYKMEVETCAHANQTTAYDSNDNGKHTVTNTCDDCDKTVSTTTVDCNYGAEQTIPATETADGKIYRACENCGYEDVIEVLPKLNLTKYTLSFSTPDVVADVESVEVAEGYTCELPSAVDYNDYTFVGWANATLDGVTTTAPTLYKAGDEYTMGNADTSLYAVYSYTEEGSGSGNFEKVTENLSDWSGEYLIVYEAGNLAFNGSLATLDVASNFIEVAISDGTIEGNDTTKAATFTIEGSDANCTIKSASGKYIGSTSYTNELKSDTTAFNHTITIESNGTTTLKASSNTTLRFNDTSNQMRFRYYKSGQKAIALYKLSAATVYYTTNIDVAHEHSYTETPIKETCTTAGGTQFDCNCGHSYFEETAAALGHDYQIASTTPGTCQAKAVTYYECSRCGATKTEEGELGGHDYVDGVCSVCEFVDPLSVNYSGYYYFTFTRDGEDFPMYVKNAWDKSNDRYMAYDNEPTSELSSYLFRLVRNEDGTYNIYEGTSNNLFAKGAENVFVVKNEEYYNIYNADGGYFSMNKDAKYDYVKFYSGKGQICDITFVEYTEIVSAGLTLGEELVVNYKLAMDDKYADAEMTFTMNGESTTVTGTKDGNVYVYSIAIAPQYMGANIAAELKLGDTVLASKATYSVTEYADFWLKNTTGEEMTNLLNALLQYGAAAQEYKDVDTDNLVADLENLGEVPEDSNDASLVSEVAKENRGISFKSAGVSFSSDNKIFVRLTNYDESVKLVVNGVEVTLNGAIYYTEGLLATQFGETFTFKLYYGETLMQTLTYSVNAYAYTLQDSENADMANLAIALYNYGAAAEAYAN